MIENKHLSDEMFHAFIQDQLSQDVQLSFLEHISQCDYCSEKLAYFIEPVTVSAPVDLKKNIIASSKRFDVQVIKNAKEMTKRMQLVLYSLKVGAATVGAFIVLLLFINFTNATKGTKSLDINLNKTKQSSDFSITNVLKNSTDSWSNQLFYFSNDIIKMEDIDHDK